ncbi:hypothetical protein [Paenibacillus humicola]|uniref:hypothetical protein n=1 Tax=Paenibacillus humicola TaxID=3110540 RepID=UPI00237B652D|nr:hypothetical protein [Paenibacillus humicola]
MKLTESVKVESIQAGIPARKRELLRSIASGGHPARSQEGLRVYHRVGLELVKFELEKLGEETEPLNVAAFEDTIDFIVARHDCCDFAQACVLRILYRYPDSKLLPSGLRERLVKLVREDKYWMLEPGEAGGCYFTENHQILFHSNEYLAGQMLEEDIFPNNGQTGEEHRQHGERMLLRWMDWRIKLDFSEWNSSCYYAEDMLALMNLHDFARDETIRKKAGDLITLLLFHIAVNSFGTDFGGTQGRVTYNISVNPDVQYVHAVFYVLWGKGELPEYYHYFQSFLTTTDYDMPLLLQRIAWDDRDEMENRERHSLNAEEARLYGVDPDDLDDLMFFWGAQLFNHRDVVASSVKYCPENYGMYAMCKAYYDHYKLYDQAKVAYDPSPDPPAMSRVDIYSYRTRSYMLGCAQQYRQGQHAYQQQIWKASLGGQAVVYTTHPGAGHLIGRPNYWIGDGVLPKAMAYKNVLVSLYHIRPDRAYFPQYPALYTHAYFPVAHFHEVVEQGRWIFGRKVDAYVALCSFRPTRWLELTPERSLPASYFADCLRPELAGQYDLAANGHNNVWICELGDATSHGSFEAFVERISRSATSGDALGMTYESPTQGLIRFGWNEPFELNGKEISLKDYPRFDNPYCKAAFGETKLHISHEGDTLEIGW